MSRRLRPTTSRDGLLRVTMHVEYRLTYSNLVTALAHSVVVYGGNEVEEDTDLSQAATLTRIRRMLAYRGANMTSNDVTDDDLAWARRQVDRVWPPNPSA